VRACRSHSEWLDLWDVHTPFASGLQSVRDLVLRKYVPGCSEGALCAIRRVGGLCPGGVAGVESPSDPAWDVGCEVVAASIPRGGADPTQ